MTAAVLVEPIGEAAIEALEHEALSKGLLAVDGARRVGWAKAFEALRRVDSLEEETRQLRDERKHLRRAYSRLLGFIQNSGVRTSHDVWDAELKLHYTAERSFRHDDAWGKGWALGGEHRAALHRWGTDEHATYEEARAAKLEQRQRMYRDLRKAARAKGHTTSLRRRNEGMATVSCSCGESERGCEERAAWDWRWEHLSQTAFGCSWGDFKKAWTAKAAS